MSDSPTPMRRATDRGHEVLAIKPDDVHQWLAEEIDRSEIATHSDIERMRKSFFRELNAFKTEYEKDQTEAKSERASNKVMMITVLCTVLSLAGAGLIALIVHLAGG